MAKPPEFKKGTGPDQLPQGAAQSLSEQVAVGRELHDQNVASLDELQTQLANGEITQEEYAAAQDAAWNTEATNLQGDLQEQGKTGMAAAVGQTINGPGAQPAPTQGTSPFSMGRVEPQAASPMPLSPLGEDSSLLFGPSGGATAPAPGPTPAPKTRPPDSLVQWLPTLGLHAQDPNAPASVKALLTALLDAFES